MLNKNATICSKLLINICKKSNGQEYKKKINISYKN
jgi:hypothetical protein